MKRFIYYLFACVATLGLFSSCSEDDSDNNPLPENPIFTSDDLTLQEVDNQTYSCEVPHNTRTYTLIFKSGVKHPEQISVTHDVLYNSFGMGSEHRDWLSLNANNQGGTTYINFTVSENPLRTEDRTLTLIVFLEYNGQNSFKYVNISQKASGSSGGEGGGDDSGQGGGQGGGNVQTGTTTAVVSVTTNYWDPWLEYIHGQTFQVEWKYNPNTGKYQFYGGPYCQNPEANGGKGLLYECQKGYNNIEICRGKDYYGSFWSFWYVYAKFTI